jgi:hypothetical protein
VARSALLLAGLAISLAACGSGVAGHPKVDKTTTTTTGKPPPTAAEATFLHDLLAVDSADKSGAATLTTLQANQSTGTTYSVPQILAAVTPVTGAITTALNDLTVLIPSLPANMTSAAQVMSDTLSETLNVYSVSTMAAQGETGLSYETAAESAAIAEEAIADLQSNESETAPLINDAESTYVAAMQSDYGTS